MNCYFVADERLVFLTVITPKYIDLLVPELVKRGYTVAAASENRQPTIQSEGCPASIIALLVAKNPMPSSPDIYNDIVKIASKLGIHFYSILITGMVDTCWNIGNLRLPDPTPKKEADQSLN